MENRILSLSANRSGAASVCTDLLPIVNNFFEQYEIEECECEIWNLLASAYSGSDMQYKDSKSISDSIFFSKNVTLLLKKLNATWTEQDNLNIERFG